MPRLVASSAPPHWARATAVHPRHRAPALASTPGAGQPQEPTWRSPARRQRDRERPGLGRAVDVADRQPARVEGVDQRVGSRLEPAQSARRLARSVRPARMLDQRLHGRGHLQGERGTLVARWHVQRRLGWKRACRMTRAPHAAPAGSGCTGRRRGTAAARSARCRPASCLHLRGDRHVGQQDGLRMHSRLRAYRWCRRCRPAARRVGLRGSARRPAGARLARARRARCPAMPHQRGDRRRRRPSPGSCARCAGAQSASSRCHSARRQPEIQRQQHGADARQREQQRQLPGWLAPSQATRSPGRTPQSCQAKPAARAERDRARRSWASAFELQGRRVWAPRLRGTSEPPGIQGGDGPFT